MIINFSVQNFYSIKDKVTLSFEASNAKDLEDYFLLETSTKHRLLKLGLIYGSNASGKTNILMALDFLRHIALEPFNRKTEKFDFLPFLFDENTPNENTIFELEFLENGTKYQYIVEFNQISIINEQLYFYRPRKALLFDRKTDLEKQLTTIDFGSKITANKEAKLVLEANTLWNNTVLGGFLKTNIEISELQEVLDWFQSKVSPIITSKVDLHQSISKELFNGKINKESLLSILKKADFQIDEIIIKDRDFPFPLDTKTLKLIDNKTVKIQGLAIDKDNNTAKIERKEILFSRIFNEKKYELPYQNESEGTKRYYQFSGLLDLMMQNASIVSIDEIASSLHPDLLKHFFLTFLTNVKKSQLICTTHYRELLMEKDMIRNDAIWFTEKKDDDSTDLYSLADFDSSVVRNTSSIYNAYKIGKLGATPTLGDVYIDANG